MLQLKSVMPPRGLGFAQVRARCKLVGSGTVAKGTVVRLDIANTQSSTNDEGSAVSGLATVILNTSAAPGILGVLVNPSLAGYECEVDFGGIVEVLAVNGTAKGAGLVATASSDVQGAAATDNVIGFSLAAAPSGGGLTRAIWFGINNFESGPLS